MKFLLHTPDLALNLFRLPKRQRTFNRMACVEAVTEDYYVSVTSSHPELYKKCKRQNNVIEAKDLKDINDKIDHERNMELKKLSRQKAAITCELRKLIIDGAVAQRSDSASDFTSLRQRRKSREFEDIELPSKLRSSGNFSSVTNYGRLNSPIISRQVIKRAMSDQKLITPKDLTIYQHWEGDPAAINSVRRELRPRRLQMENTNFVRSRRYDTYNEPVNSVVPPFLSRQSSSASLKPLNTEITHMNPNRRSPIPSIKSASKQTRKLGESTSKPAELTDQPLDEPHSARGETSKELKQEGNDESASSSLAESQLSQNKKRVKSGVKKSKQVSPEEKACDTSTEKNGKKSGKQGKRKSSFGNNKIQPQ